MAKITRVDDLKRQAEFNTSKKVWLYNPDSEDFTVKYAGTPYTLLALDSAEFDYHVAEHIKKHLANRLLNKRGIKINSFTDLMAIKKEIEMGI